MMADLKGWRVTSVDFTLNDYMGMVFENRSARIAMSILVWPSLTKRGESIAIGTDEYRATLSRLGGLLVEKARGSEDVIEIAFQDDLSIRVPLDTDTPSGEHIIITGPDHLTIVG
jgi:hypothetical protein